MNAPVHAAHLTTHLSGELLLSGWQHTDTLQLDLYGSLPTEDDGYIVESITVHGHHVDITELFTASQLEHMGKHLDFKDDTNPTLRRVAEHAKFQAVQGPWEKNRGAY